MTSDTQRRRMDAKARKVLRRIGRQVEAKTHGLLAIEVQLLPPAHIKRERGGRITYRWPSGATVCAWPGGWEVRYESRVRPMAWSDSDIWSMGRAARLVVTAATEVYAELFPALLAGIVGRPVKPDAAGASRARGRSRW